MTAKYIEDKKKRVQGNICFAVVIIIIFVLCYFAFGLQVAVIVLLVLVGIWVAIIIALLIWAKRMLKKTFGGIKFDIDIDGKSADGKGAKRTHQTVGPLKITAPKNQMEAPSHVEMQFSIDIPKEFQQGDGESLADAKDQHLSFRMAVDIDSDTDADEKD